MKNILKFIGLSLKSLEYILLINYQLKIKLLLGTNVPQRKLEGILSNCRLDHFLKYEYLCLNKLIQSKLCFHIIINTYFFPIFHHAQGASLILTNG